MKYVLVILYFCLLNTTFADILQEKRKPLAEAIKGAIQERSLPNDNEKYVKTVIPKVTIMVNKIKISEIPLFQRRYGMPDQLAKDLTLAQIMKVTSFQTFNEIKQDGFHEYEETIGSTYKIDQEILFALVRIFIKPQLYQQFTTKTVRECSRTWLFFTECHDVQKQVPIGFTDEQNNIISESLKYYASINLKKYADYIVNGDYDIYMTDGNMIGSDDGNSIAYVADWGNIAIGPRSEMNAVVPVEYRVKTGPTTKYIPVGDYVTDDWEENGGNVQIGGGWITYGRGSLNKFNFIHYNSFDPCDHLLTVDRRMKEDRLKGPYVFEIKSNGNMILYSQKSKNTIWSSNTAGKGVGPYNLLLSNDRKLMLIDSKGQIIYRSDEYVDGPTVYFQFYHNGEWSKLRYNNSQILDNGNVIEAIKLGIEADDKAFSIEYRSLQGQYTIDKHPSTTYCPQGLPSAFSDIRQMEDACLKYVGSTWNDYMGVTLNPDYNKNDIYVLEAFAARLSENRDYDICYSALSTDWHDYACNGDPVGTSGYMERIRNLFFIIKPKEVTLEKLNNNEPFKRKDGKRSNEDYQISWNK